MRLYYKNRTKMGFSLSEQSVLRNKHEGSPISLVKLKSSVALSILEAEFIFALAFSSAPTSYADATHITLS